MEIKYVSQDGAMFGTTKFLALGKRKPELVYGTQAKKLREDAGITVEDLSKELSIKKDLIEGIEATKKGMTEDVMARYCEKFGVEKEYFFDTELEVYICNDTGNIVKGFESPEECKKQYNFLKEAFLEGCKEDVKNYSMFVDFSKEV